MNSNETPLPDRCKSSKIQSPQRRICHCVHCLYNAFLLDLWVVVVVVVAGCKGGGGGAAANVAALISSHLERYLVPPRCKEHMPAAHTNCALS